MDVKAAINICKEIIETNMFNRHTDAYAIEVVLSELEKKDKIIELMAKYIKEPYQLYIFKGRMTKLKAIIEYFTNKVEKEGK